MLLTRDRCILSRKLAIKTGMFEQAQHKVNSDYLQYIEEAELLKRDKVNSLLGSWSDIRSPLPELRTYEQLHNLQCKLYGEDGRDRDMSLVIDNRQQ